MHRNSPDFLISCCYEPCAYSTKSWNAFKMHVSRYHTERNTNLDADNPLAAAADFSFNDPMIETLVDKDANSFNVT